MRRALRTTFTVFLLLLAASGAALAEDSDCDATSSDEPCTTAECSSQQDSSPASRRFAYAPVVSTTQADSKCTVTASGVVCSDGDTTRTG